MTVQTRVYVPLTVATLRRLGTSGHLEPAPFTAYAVTTDLRREDPNADEEELEFLAFTDVVTDLLAPAAAVSAVRVATALPRRQVASFHVANAEPGSDGRPDYSWYDATEIEAVLDLLG